MGHLEEKDAIDIVTRAEKHLRSNAIDKDQIPIARLVQLPQYSVHEYEQLNHDPNNPNSAVLCQFQLPKLRIYDDEAILGVLFH